jgi:acyl-coenzyme A thioesterase PaaI-like protein
MEHRIIDSPSPRAADPIPDPFDDGRALQDRLQVTCFGCGALNAHGLHIKSRWKGDELVCVWQPRPEHIGLPGYVYGGTIASVVDCHAIWASLSTYCREAGHDLGSGEPPFGVVTGRLQVNYLKPARVAQALELSARVVAHDERKSVVACRVRQGAVECAIAEVIAVRVKGMV